MKVAGTAFISPQTAVRLCNIGKNKRDRFLKWLLITVLQCSFKATVRSLQEKKTPHYRLLHTILYIFCFLFNARFTFVVFRTKSHFFCSSTNPALLSILFPSVVKITLVEHVCFSCCQQASIEITLHGCSNQYPQEESLSVTDIRASLHGKSIQLIQALVKALRSETHLIFCEFTISGGSVNSRKT